MNHGGRFALRYKDIYYIFNCEDAARHESAIRQEIMTAKMNGTFGTWRVMLCEARLKLLTDEAEGVQAGEEEGEKLQDSLLSLLESGRLNCEVEDEESQNADFWVDLETGETYPPFPAFEQIEDDSDETRESEAAAIVTNTAIHNARMALVDAERAVRELLGCYADVPSAAEVLLKAGRTLIEAATALQATG
jgi:hypothetical protein